MIKNCWICGKPFETKGNQHYCSNECRKEAMIRPDNSKPAPINEEKPKHVSRLVEINRKAKELGMTYGQYQAMLYMEGVK